MNARYITAGRVNLLTAAANRNYLDLDIVQTSNFEGYVGAHGQQLGGCRLFVLDLLGLNDSNDEIKESLNMLSVIYGEMRIVVLADADDGIRQDMGELLRRIHALGIYNTITTLTEDELDFCILEGRSQPQVQSQSQTLETNVTTTQNLSQSEMPTSDEITQISTASNIRANKEFRKFKDYISVSVCGAQSRTGTTHAALQMTKFLKDVGFKACYVEAHQGGQIYIIKEFYPQTTANQRKHMLQFQGLNIFYTGFDMVRLMAGKYDFYVFDLGVLNKQSLNQFLMRDVKVLTSGAKPWEIPALKDAINVLNGGVMPHFLLNHAPKTDQASIMTYLGQKDKLHFAQDAPNPFKGGANTDIFKTIFKDYIMQDQPPQAQESRRKRGFFR